MPNPPDAQKYFGQHFSTYVSQNVHVGGNTKNLFFIKLVAELVPRCRYPWMDTEFPNK